MEVLVKMNGKDRIYRAFKHEDVDRVPWVPFAGIHAGKLKGYTATEVLQDGNKLLECLREVKRQYQPDGQPVMFDLQVEAEILGCQLRWADKAPPSIEDYPLKGTNEIPDRIPGPGDGRLPMILDVMRRFSDEVGGDTALFGLVTGPLTLASHLRGTRLFVDTIRAKDYTRELLRYTMDVGMAMADMYIDAGMDVIAIVDPVVSQVSPRAFADLLHEPISALFKHVRNKGALSAFFVCGDATKNIEPMCKTGPDSIFIDENINIGEAKKITDAHDIVIGGNIPLTAVMLYGTQQDNMKYVVDLIDKVGKENLVIAPGCDMPYDIPPENVLGVVQAIQEPVKVKKMLEGYQATEFSLDTPLPDYDNLEKPLVEVFTIDSDTCPACGYMYRVAISAKEKFGDRVDVVEYKWTSKENIARAKLLGVTNLPSILINGKVVYSSLIPSEQDYHEKLRSYLE